MATALAIVQKVYPFVDKVTDATEALQVEVTPSLNKLATIKNHKKCAIAVACEKKFALDGVVIGLRTAYLVRGTKAIRYRLPENVSREIISFDRKGGFEPGQYTLNAPAKSERLGSIPYNGHKSRGGGKKRKAPHVTTNVRASLKTKDVA